MKTLIKPAYRKPSHKNPGQKKNVDSFLRPMEPKSVQTQLTKKFPTDQSEHMPL